MTLSDPAKIQEYINLMNKERMLCGSAPFYGDERLQQIAEERLQQVFQFGFTHLPGGVDPKPALCQKYGFPIGDVVNYEDIWLNNISEGLAEGSFDPAGLMIPSEQYPHEAVWSPKVQSHHSDLICTRWNLVAHSFGTSPHGVQYSVTNYGDGGGFISPH